MVVFEGILLQLGRHLKVPKQLGAWLLFGLGWKFLKKDDSPCELNIDDIVLAEGVVGLLAGLFATVVQAETLAADAKDAVARRLGCVK